jgi:SpoVK/Ycf46/Vps4 family AAA+-type ATPase
VAPCIVLLENVDSFGREDDVKIIQQIEECMDELKENIVVLGLCRNICLVDDGLKTYGRFDTDIMMRIPNETERLEILKSLVKDIRIDGLDLELIVKKTPGFLGSDLNKLVRTCVNKALERGSSTVTSQDFEDCLAEKKKSNSNTEAITFENIGALKRVKEELEMSIIFPLRYPEKFKRIGIRKPSGVLLYGPPGCGKTLLARAVSNMSHCNFISVRGPELIDKYVGESEKNIRKIFEDARHSAPCVIFFDEIDSLCLSRTTNDFSSRVVNQILTLLDGLEDRGEVYVIGATNRIENLDTALLRPGRFDRLIEVPLPSSEERLEIFKTCVKNVPVEPFDLEEMDLGGYSGADISGLVKEASLACLKDNFDNSNLTITKEYFMKVLRDRKGRQILFK